MDETTKYICQKRDYARVQRVHGGLTIVTNYDENSLLVYVFQLPKDRYYGNTYPCKYYRLLLKGMSIF